MQHSIKRLEVDLLGQLVALPTVTGNFSSNNQALDLASTYLAARGMYIERRDYNGYGALVATTRPTKTPKVMLVAHTDVVAARDALFCLREADGRLYGRGVWDMKFAIAGYMAVVEALRQRLPDYDFGIMLTSDEETADLGVKYLLEEGFIPQVVILPDGANDWQVEVTAKGAMYPHITVTGKTAHGSRPWLGDSASFKTVELLAEIKAWFKDQGPDTKTLNISAIEIGSMQHGQNRIPDLARVCLDIRVLDDAEVEYVKRQLTKICKRYGASYEISAFFPPLRHDSTNPFVAQFAESVQRVTGIQNQGFHSLGASSAVHFMPRGIPCVVTSPTGGDRHSDDEWVDKASFLHMTPILLDYLSHTAITS